MEGEFLILYLIAATQSENFKGRCNFVEGYNLRVVDGTHALISHLEKSVYTFVDDKIVKMRLPRFGSN